MSIFAVTRRHRWAKYNAAERAKHPDKTLNAKRQRAEHRATQERFDKERLTSTIENPDSLRSSRTVYVRVPNFPPVRTAVEEPGPKARKRHRGPVGKAKILNSEQRTKALAMAKKRGRYPDRDTLFFLLSHCAGLRAKEIASIHYEDITDVEGNFTGKLYVSKRGAKYGSARHIVLNKVVSGPLQRYVKSSMIVKGPIFWTDRGAPMNSNAVQKALKAIYDACGFEGARSHSGRRYAITTMAQNANNYGASLEDVRIFAGHSDLKTTAEYIDESPRAADLINALLDADPWMRGESDLEEQAAMPAFQLAKGSLKPKARFRRYRVVLRFSHFWLL